MVEISFMVDSIRQGDTANTLVIRLQNEEYDYNIDLTLPSSTFSTLGAFPGSKVKVSIEKA